MGYGSASAVVGISVSGGVVDKPAGTVSGELLLAVVNSDGFNAAAIAGWDTPNAFVQNIAYDNQSLQGITKTAGGSEPANYTVTNVSLGALVTLRIAGYTGGALIFGTPGVTGAGVGVPTPISAVAPSITIPGTGTYTLLCIAGLDQDTDEAWTPTAPSGMTLQITANPAGEFSGFAVASLDNAPAGATGTKTMTFAGGAGQAGWAALLVAVPVTAGGGGSPYAVSAAATMALAGTATTQVVDGAAAAAAITLGATATSQRSGAGAAAAAITLGGTATAQLTEIAAAAAAVVMGATATNLAVKPAAATATMAMAGTATNLAVKPAAAAAAVTLAGTATSLEIDSNSAAQSVTLAGTATSQTVVGAAAAASMAMGATAAATAGSDLLGAAAISLAGTATTQEVVGGAAAASIALAGTASSQAVMGAAAATAIALAGTATAQQTDLASATQNITLGATATASAAGGNVYDVSASETMDLNDSATGPGLLHVFATDGIFLGAAASASSSGDGDLQDQIDALRLQVEELARIKALYIGGPDYNDFERRRLLDLDRGPTERERIETQNRWLMDLIRQVVGTKDQGRTQ